MHHIQVKLMGVVVNNTFQTREALYAYIDWLIATNQNPEGVTIVLNRKV